MSLSLVTEAAHAGDLVGSSQQGKTLFEHQCSVCHSMTANRVGPILSGVYGRKVGSVPGFNYSSALKASSVTWGDITLDKWLTGPQQFIPGQKMNFGVTDPQKRADLIAYLKLESDSEAK